jgi:energy-coupling factor transporter ATP-binding protein EcfA2
MVKSLHALVNYFRRRAQHADLLVLDEPEMNLHPDNQIKMARLIVEWVNAGFKVLISTHSNYILRELNNMILLSEKPKSKQSAALRKKYGYGKEHLISKDNVGVHFFNDGKVAQIPVTDDGFEIKTIEEAVFDLNERSEEIFFKHDR